MWADHGGVVMARSANGEAISARRKTPAAVKKLESFAHEAERENDLEQWRRGKAVLGYIAKRSVIALAGELGVTRGSVIRRQLSQSPRSETASPAWILGAASAQATRAPT